MTAPARKPDAAPNPTPTPDLPPDIARSAEALGFGQLEDFFREAEKIMAEAEKAAEAAPTPEEASRWERLKNYVKEIWGSTKAQADKTIDEVTELKKKGVGEPPVPLNAGESAKTDALIAKIKKAEETPRVAALAGTRQEQMAILSGMYEVLAKQAEKNKPVDQDALYKKLLAQGAEYVVDPETGKGVYTKMTDKENERLAELEGRNLSDADFKQIVEGKKPWDLNALSRAMNMLRNNQLPGESDLEKARREREQNDPEKKLVNDITAEYFSFTDMPGLSDGKKAKLVEIAKNTPGIAETAKAMDNLIKAHSKEEVAKRAEQARWYLLEKIMKKLKIEPSKFSQSKSWAFREMARQYVFLERPDKIELGDNAADPIISDQKLNEIISRHLGWELYRQKAQGLDNGLLGQLDQTKESYQKIAKLLDKKAEKNGSLSFKDLSTLGELIRSNIGEYSTEEMDETRHGLSVEQAEKNYKRADDELESIRTDLDIMDEIDGTLTRAGRMVMIEHNLAMLGDYTRVGTIEREVIKRFDENGDTEGKYKFLKELFDEAVKSAREQENKAKRRLTLADADLKTAKAANAKDASPKTPDNASDPEKEARIKAIMAEAQAYIGTKEQIEKLNQLDAVHLAVKKTDLEGDDLDKLRAALCGEAWTGLKLEDAQLLEKENLDILAEELLEIVNQTKDERLANVKPSPTKPMPAPAPTKPAAGPASPNAKTVDARSDEEKALIKAILINVDKKIAQAQKESLAYENNPATSALRETKKLINEISNANELKEMLINAEYLTKEDAAKLNDEEMALIRDQIVRDIDEVLFVKNKEDRKASVKNVVEPKPAPKNNEPAVEITPEEKERLIDAAIASALDLMVLRKQNLEHLSIDELEDEREKIEAGVKPDFIKKKLIQGKYLTPEQADRLGDLELQALRNRLLGDTLEVLDRKSHIAPNDAKEASAKVIKTLEALDRQIDLTHAENVNGIKEQIAGAGYQKGAVKKRWLQMVKMLQAPMDRDALVNAMAGEEVPAQTLLDNLTRQELMERKQRVIDNLRQEIELADNLEKNLSVAMTAAEEPAPIATEPIPTTDHTEKNALGDGLTKAQKSLFTKIDRVIQSGLEKEKTTPEQLEIMNMVYELYQEETKETNNVGLRLKLKEKYRKMLKDELAKNK